MSGSSDAMGPVVHCPDCGGVVGATTTTDAGPPCRCFADLPARPAPGGDDAPESENERTATDAPATVVEKLCALCGKNVAGHRRLKDSRGYICLDCAKAEKAAGKIQGVKCPKCMRVVKEESLNELDGQRMCQRCLREARELRRPGSKRFRKIDHQHFEQQNKTQLYVLAGVALVLLIIMLIGWLR
jgi:hypothetical protein